MSTNIFEHATRIKLRYATSMGLLSYEDLWNLPLTSARGNVCLDDIAKAANANVNLSQEESFVTKPAPKDLEAILAFDIVKHIIDVRLTENAARLAAQDKAAKKGKILELIADKQDDVLKGSSMEELQKMLDDLG